MNHPRNVERNFREQKITHHVLQAQNQTEYDLAGKQNQGEDEVGHGDPLRLVFHVFSLSLRCWVASRYRQSWTSTRGTMPDLRFPGQSG